MFESMCIKTKLNWCLLIGIPFGYFGMTIVLHDPTWVGKSFGAGMLLTGAALCLIVIVYGFGTDNLKAKIEKRL